MANKNLRCLNCREYFPRESMTRLPVGNFHAQDCIVEYAQNKLDSIKKKNLAKDTREGRQRLKTRSEWIKDCQVWVNRYIKVRDEGRGCISCQTKSNDNDLLTGSRFDAGHYRSVGSSPSLRFYTLNIARQCVKCNRDLSGNTVSMRAGLVERYGKSKVEAIEAMQKPLKPDIEYCQRLIALMKKKIKLYKKLRDK